MCAPTLDEIERKSIWVALGIEAKDMRVPDTEVYTGQMPKEHAYLFPIYWCAKTPQIFHENMQHVFTELVVDGEIIPDKYIFTYNYNRDSGWSCNFRSVILSGWQQDTEYVLEMRRIIDQEISDGD